MSFSSNQGYGVLLNPERVLLPVILYTIAATQNGLTPLVKGQKR
jgi:hypothetical protein